jgi:hypothetical protein
MYYRHVPSSKRIKGMWSEYAYTYYIRICSLDALEYGGVGARNFTLELYLNFDFSHLIAVPSETIHLFSYFVDLVMNRSLMVCYLNLLPSFSRTLEMQVADCSETTVCTKLHSAFKTDTEVSPEMFVTNPRIYKAPWWRRQQFFVCSVFNDPSVRAYSKKWWNGSK